MIALSLEIDTNSLDKRFMRLPVEVRQKVAMRAIRSALNQGVKVAQATYPRSRRMGFHLQDHFFARIKDYKFAVWGAMGVRVSGGSRQTALPGWRFHFTERDRRSRAGVGRASRLRLRERSDGGIREGGVTAGRVIRGEHRLPGIFLKVGSKVMPEMRRLVAKVLA